MKFLYIIKNILFIPFIYALIRLLPNMLEVKIIGIVFLVIIIVGIIFELLSFLIKHNDLKYSDMTNIMSILLYIYICLITYKYIQTVNVPANVIDPLYFEINYILASLGMIGIIVNIFITIKNLKRVS